MGSEIPYRFNQKRGLTSVRNRTPLKTKAQRIMRQVDARWPGIRCPYRGFSTCLDQTFSAYAWQPISLPQLTYLDRSRLTPLPDKCHDF